MWVVGEVMIAIWNCDTKDIDRCYKKDKTKCDELISNFQNKTKKRGELWTLRNNNYQNGIKSLKINNTITNNV